MMRSPDPDSKLLRDEMKGTVFVGAFEPAAARRPITDKSSGETIWEGGVADVGDVAHAAIIARAAQPAWAAELGIHRGDVLREFAALCRRHGEEITQLIVRETGSIPPKAAFELESTIREAIEIAGCTGHPQGYILQSTNARPSYARRVPLGVVGVITPWNSPFILAARVVLPALAAGNAVVLKPDVQTPVTGGYLLAELFERAGLPNGVFCVAPGDAATGKALVESDDIAMISFTGSTAAGRDVASRAARGLKRVALELGGNNAAIVFEDCDLEKAVSAAAFGSFFHQGQICFSIGRHLVHESIAPRYAEALALRASNLGVGDPSRAQVHLGPLINERQSARVEELLQSSLDDGAELLAGGKREGLFFQPTVVTGVSESMSLFCNETFGPVAAITTFASEVEAIALANNTEYGLVASIFTSDLSKAMRVAGQLRSGIIHVNDQTVAHEVFAPIGGMGASGNGARSGALTALDEYTQWQWLTISSEIPAYPF